MKRALQAARWWWLIRRGTRAPTTGRTFTSGTALVASLDQTEAIGDGRPLFIDYGDPVHLEGPHPASLVADPHGGPVALVAGKPVTEADRVRRRASLFRDALELLRDQREVKR